MDGVGHNKSLAMASGGGGVYGDVAVQGSDDRGNQPDRKSVMSTVHHDMLVVQVTSVVLQPHAENPLQR